MGGYETFTLECFRALSEDSSLSMHLVKGSGKPEGEREIVVPCLKRNSIVGNAVSKIPQVGKLPSIHPYLIEQVTFALSLGRYLKQYKPDVIYFSDRAMGRIASRLYKQRFGVAFLFSNGGGFPPPFAGFDHVQHVTPDRLAMALEQNDDRVNHSLVPYGFAIPRSQTPASAEEKIALRNRLGLPQDRPIILSVGVLSRVRKRMDYLVREVAQINGPKPFVVMLGQPALETNELTALADTLLGRENYMTKTVPYSQVADYYRAADLFALASVNESFGRVYVEALSHGLPCIAHRYAITDYVVGDAGFLIDMATPGSLSNLLNSSWNDLGISDPRSAQRRFQHAYDNFSWETLTSRYVDMIHSTRKPTVAADHAVR